jgi:hypothetical protein
MWLSVKSGIFYYKPRFVHGPGDIEHVGCLLLSYAYGIIVKNIKTPKVQ